MKNPKIKLRKKPYNQTKVKNQLKSEADKLWKQAILLKSERCEVCGSDYGLTAHHFFPRSLAGHMVYLLDNGITLCRGCHFAHHFKSDPTIHQKIIVSRGEKWYNKLAVIKKEQHYSLKTMQWYKDNIQRLKNGK